MDFDSLQACVYNRLLWINCEIRSARGTNDAEKLKRFVEYRKDTDRLLSQVKLAILKDPHDLKIYEELSLLYRSKSLI